ncbi:hypothetical protein CR51_36020 [Caballeronia megalochromosomata]|nr:hypothetical protein CR51_36020 [Caballeronia megalochromosomata]
MPQLLKDIDVIAREKQRDVLYLTFTQADQQPSPVPSADICTRRKIIEWLNANKVGWSMCGDIAEECTMRSYAGQLYIDVPYDTSDPVYQAVQQFLEYPDGTMRFEDAKFWIVPLELAMTNAHHDEPGFWDRWAEDF